MSTVGQAAGYVIGGVVGAAFPAVGWVIGAQIGGMIGGYIDPPKGANTVGPPLPPTFLVFVISLSLSPSSQKTLPVTAMVPFRRGMTAP